jgi:hypothetical protein
MACPFGSFASAANELIEYQRRQKAPFEAG